MHCNIVILLLDMLNITGFGVQAGEELDMCSFHFQGLQGAPGMPGMPGPNGPSVSVCYHLRSNLFL